MTVPDFCARQPNSRRENSRHPPLQLQGSGPPTCHLHPTGAVLNWQAKEGGLRTSNVIGCELPFGGHGSTIEERQTRPSFAHSLTHLTLHFTHTLTPYPLATHTDRGAAIHSPGVSVSSFLSIVCSFGPHFGIPDLLRTQDPEITSLVQRGAILFVR